MAMDVALLGLVLPNVQNHSLARLAAAVRGAGFTSEIVPFRGFPDIDTVVRVVTDARPRMCGVSIQTGEAALASVTLVEMLRLRGYRGQIVVGGHFATLNAEELLREVKSIDVVVRFAGEPALRALLRGPADATALESMPGVLFRDDTGQVRSGAPPVLDAPAGVAAPAAEALPVHLGFPAADIVGSRGCEAHCSYCCVAGAADIAERGGASRYQRQTTDALADELARLYHHQGARAFNFMDDNLLPMEPDAAADWIAAMSRGLRARNVGRIAFSLQLRADVCTPDVVDGLRDLGLVRGYVGIDGYSGRQLVALGRDAPASAGPLALELLAAGGVFTVCNALILGPTFKFAALRNEIEALGQVRHAPVHLLPIDVRKGSTYFDRVERRGLLEGGMLLRRYRFEDPRTALLAEAVTGFPTRLEEYSVPIALYDLGYNLGIARRLVPDADVAAAVETYRDVTASWNVDQLRVLRGAAAAADTLDRQAVVAFVAAERDRVRVLDDQLRAACGGAMWAVERAVSRVRGTDVKVHRRGGLLSGVALSMMLAACGQPKPLSAPPDGGDANGLDAPKVDVLSVDRNFTGVDATDPDLIDFDAFSAVCGDGGRMAMEYGKPVVFPECCWPSANGAQITFNDAGIPVSLSLPDGGTASNNLLNCVLSSLAGYCYPSVAGTTQPLVNAHCWIA